MAKISFNNKNASFYPSLKASVEQYFQENHLKKTGNYKLYLKAVVLMSVSIFLYVTLLAYPLPAFTVLVMGGLLGFTLASIGFNVMHDACHGSYSSKPWVNDLLGLTLNALGGNAYIWKQKHNVIHHTYTNIDGVDDDIAKSPIMRQCHTQVWKPFHKFQHLYVILVYAISSFAWVFIMDFTKYGQKKIYKTALNPMKTKNHVIFWASKVLYLIFYIGLPIYFMGVQSWALFFVSMHIMMGLTLAIVFQLAHVVEETEFDVVGIDDKLIEEEWAIFQLKTTANFARENKVVSWFVGGLNFQVEHHLFPRISHIHYPALSKIVEAKCKEFDIPYLSMPTMSAAVVSHFKFMRTLGQEPPVLAVSPVRA